MDELGLIACRIRKLIVASIGQYLSPYKVFCGK